MKNKDQKFLEKAYQKIQESSSEWEPILHELSKGIPGPSIFSLLQNIKKSGRVSALIDHLNSEEDWVRKDSLIKALFMGLTKEDL